MNTRALRVSGWASEVIRNDKVTFAIALILLIIGLLKVAYVEAQASENGALKMDTLSVLQGRMKVILKTGTFDTMEMDQLQKLYSSSFNIGKILCANGFRMGENSSLRFYQTNIENFDVNDGGLSTWKLILSFTDKITPQKWLESGWTRQTNGSYTYFVKLICPEKEPQFLKFSFYYIDNKLAFSLFQCPAHTLAINPGETDKYLSIAANDPHPSRFTGGK